MNTTVNLERFRRKKADHDTIVSVKYSPSGRFLATADKSGNLSIWLEGRLHKSTRLRTSYEPLTGIWFSEDETWFFAGHQFGHVVVYSLPKMLRVGYLQLKTERSDSSNVLVGTTPVLDWVILIICPANDANFYAVLEHGDFFEIRRKDLQVVKHLHLGNIFCCSAASLDGRVLFLGDDYGYILRGRVPVSELELLGEHYENVPGIDREGRSIIMNAMTGIAGLAITPDLTLVASSSRSGGMQIWDAQTVIEKSFPARGIKAKAVRDPIREPGSVLQIVERPQTAWMRGISFVPNAQAALGGQDDGRITYWEYQYNQSSLWAKCPEGVRSIDFSPDGTQVAIGCEDGGLFVVPWSNDISKGLLNRHSGGWFKRLLR